MVRVHNYYYKIFQILDTFQKEITVKPQNNQITPETINFEPQEEPEEKLKIQAQLDPNSELAGGRMGCLRLVPWNNGCGGGWWSHHLYLLLISCFR